MLAYRVKYELCIVQINVAIAYRVHGDVVAN